MTQSPIKRTNVEGTCLWCGEKLRHRYNTEWEHYQLDPSTFKSKCCDAPVVKPWGGLYYCSNDDCDKVQTLTRKRVKSRTQLSDKPGGYGDGFFCTLNCGHSFAVAAANNGYRFVPTKESNNDG